MSITNDKFLGWQLDTWANILEVIGFLMSIAGILISLFIKSEISRLKTSYIFEKRITAHIKKLESHAGQLNSFLNDYDANRSAIKTEISVCETELTDLLSKVGYLQGRKTRRLIRFIKRRKKRPFIAYSPGSSSALIYFSKHVTRIYETSYNDIWVIYNSLLEVITQMKNFKLNQAKG